MLAQQEPADDEMRAGANESFDVWSVFFVQRHRNQCFHGYFPGSFEVFPPCREFAESAGVIQHDVKLSVVRRRKFGYQDPCEEVQPGQTEVMEVVLLHAPPAK